MINNLKIARNNFLIFGSFCPTCGDYLFAEINKANTGLKVRCVNRFCYFEADTSEYTPNDVELINELLEELSRKGDGKKDKNIKSYPTVMNVYSTFGTKLNSTGKLKKSYNPWIDNGIVVRGEK